MNEPRVLIYTAGKTGVGQTRRATRLATYISDALGGSGSVLVASGAPRAEGLFPTSGASVISLVSVSRLITSLRMSGSPKLVRRAVEDAEREVLAVVDHFRPTVFVTTTHRGVAGELMASLSRVASRRCRRVLALRDIYSPPNFADDYLSLTPDDFDCVIVGGPPFAQRWMPEGLVTGPLAPHTHYVGYLRPPIQRQKVAPVCCREPVILCRVGGGRDGKRVAAAAIRALDRIQKMADDTYRLYVATGPWMPRQDVAEIRAAAGENVFVRRWWPSDYPTGVLPGRAQLTVSMAGYGSAVEAAWNGEQAVLAARWDPSDHEQAVRAWQFERLFRNTTASRADSTEHLEECIVAKWSNARELRKRPVNPVHLFSKPAEVASLVLGSSCQFQASPDASGGSPSASTTIPSRNACGI